jgi:hypothetical protein
MAVQTSSFARTQKIRWRYEVRPAFSPALLLSLLVLTLFVARGAAQDRQLDWQTQVRTYCDAND